MGEADFAIGFRTLRPIARLVERANARLEGD